MPVMVFYVHDGSVLPNMQIGNQIFIEKKLQKGRDLLKKIMSVINNKFNSTIQLVQVVFEISKKMESFLEDIQTLPPVSENVSKWRKFKTLVIRFVLCFKRKRTEYQLKKTAIHEAGHAIVALMTDHEVFCVSIIPNGKIVGETWTNGQKYMEWFSTPMLQISIDIGGHVAEELFFGKSQLFGRDKKKVEELALNMVTKWGMSSNSKFKYLNVMKASEEDKKFVNDEVDAIKHKAKIFAKEIIKEHRDEVIKIAAVLMEHHFLSGREIKDIVKGNSAFFS